MSEFTATTEHSNARPLSFTIEQMEGRMARGQNAFVVKDEEGIQVGHFGLSWRHPVLKLPSGREVRKYPFGISTLTVLSWTKGQEGTESVKIGCEVLVGIFIATLQPLLHSLAVFPPMGPNII